MGTDLRWGAPLTYDDLQAMPEDGHRYELVDGALIVTPTPSIAHQVCAAELHVLLRSAAPAGLIAMLPIHYVVKDTTVLIPDLLVCRRSDLGTKNLPAAPVLVVEVLSPSTRHIDRGLKRMAFEEAGIPAYWIVDPLAPGLLALRLDDGAFVEDGRVTGAEAYESDHPFPVRVVPADLIAPLQP